MRVKLHGAKIGSRLCKLLITAAAFRHFTCFHVFTLFLWRNHGTVCADLQYMCRNISFICNSSCYTYSSSGGGNFAFSAAKGVYSDAKRSVLKSDVWHKNFMTRCATCRSSATTAKGDFGGQRIPGYCADLAGRRPPQVAFDACLRRAEGAHLSDAEPREVPRVGDVPRDCDGQPALCGHTWSFRCFFGIEDTLTAESAVVFFDRAERVSKNTTSPRAN